MTSKMVMLEACKIYFCSQQKKILQLKTPTLLKYKNTDKRRNITRTIPQDRDSRLLNEILEQGSWKKIVTMLVPDQSSNLEYFLVEPVFALVKDWFCNKNIQENQGKPRRIFKWAGAELKYQEELFPKTRENHWEEIRPVIMWPNPKTEDHGRGSFRALQKHRRFLYKVSLIIMLRWLNF